MVNRAAEIVHTTILLHLGLGTLSMAECLKIAKDYLETKGVKKLIDLPVDEMLKGSVEICKLMNDEAIKRKGMKF